MILAAKDIQTWAIYSHSSIKERRTATMLCVVSSFFFLKLSNRRISRKRKGRRRRRSEPRDCFEFKRISLLVFCEIQTEWQKSEIELCGKSCVWGSLFWVPETLWTVWFPKKFRTKFAKLPIANESERFLVFTIRFHKRNLFRSESQQTV